MQLCAEPIYQAIYLGGSPEASYPQATITQHRPPPTGLDHQRPGRERSGLARHVASRRRCSAMADDAGREGAGDGDGKGDDPDEPGRAEDDRSNAPLTDTHASTLAIALISSAAALLGACVGLAGSYLATTLQVGSQEYLQHRNDLRGSCSAVP